MALDLTRHLNTEELKLLLPSLVAIASSQNGYLLQVRDLITSLPREWLLENIEKEAEIWLSNGSEEEYRRFLELYERLDETLTSVLAKRAIEHSDSLVREAGWDFICL